HLTSLSAPRLSLKATATTEIYTLSLHDALPICPGCPAVDQGQLRGPPQPDAGGHRHLVADPLLRHPQRPALHPALEEQRQPRSRSEEHTSELQSRENLVCRLLLEKKKKKPKVHQ